MTEIDILKHAKEYLDKLAEGIDPLTGAVVSDTDVVRQTRISRCLTYVSDVLGRVIARGGLETLPPVNLPVKKQRLPAFTITKNALEQVFDWAQNFEYDMVYANGFVAHVSSKARNGLTFHGEKGDIFFYPGKLERPEFLAKWNEKKDLKDSDRRLYHAAGGHCHEMDFVDGIYDNRPICTDCEIGHRSIAACHIANICERLRLKKLTWDPAKETFTGDGKNDVQAIQFKEFLELGFSYTFASKK